MNRAQELHDLGQINHSNVKISRYLNYLTLYFAFLSLGNGKTNHFALFIFLG